MTPADIPATMPAVVFDGHLKLMPDHPVPVPPAGWALIRTLAAGICRTDLEIIKGYMGFSGVLGHEFVGEILACAQPQWHGRRITGEINAACGRCRMCRAGLARHCPERKVLGILSLDGCMAAYCMLPTANLHVIPTDMSTDRAAFIEPLSAAGEILDQVQLSGAEHVAVLGDGRLGILCAWALATAVDNVILVGRHPHKLSIARWRQIRTTTTLVDAAGADLVVEATGKPRGLTDAMAVCRPRGTIVLKSTLASQGDLNLAPLVINEITVIGSRCGLFKTGLALLQQHPDMPVERLITARYPLEQALDAFERARSPDVLKILLETT
jgi:alcohol dehydrogenase